MALRKGIELLLSRRGCVVAGAADDARAGYAVIKAKRPDVAIIDVGLRGESGTQLRGSPWTKTKGRESSFTLAPRTLRLSPDRSTAARAASCTRRRSRTS